MKADFRKVKTAIEQGQVPNETDAKNRIAAALGVQNPTSGKADGTAVQETIQYLLRLFQSKEIPKKQGKERLISILKIVGNLGMGYFGVPVRIP